MSTEMPLHALSSEGNAAFSDGEGAAVSSGDAVIRQNPWALHPEHILVALRARHDQ